MTTLGCALFLQHLREEAGWDGVLHIDPSALYHYLDSILDLAVDNPLELPAHMPKLSRMLAAFLQVVQSPDELLEYMRRPTPLQQMKDELAASLGNRR